MHMYAILLVPNIIIMIIKLWQYFLVIYFIYVQQETKASRWTFSLKYWFLWFNFVISWYFIQNR